MNYTLIKKIILYSFTIVLSVFVFYIGYVVVTENYDSRIPAEEKCLSTALGFNFESALSSLPTGWNEEDFPYDSFINSGVYCSAAAVKRNLEEFNNVNPGQERQNRSILIRALTSELETVYKSRFDKFNPDSLIKMVQWVDEFKTYEEIEHENRSLYGIVHDHWMDFVSNQLSEHYKENPKIKFEFKFKYLQEVCLSKKFASSVGKSKLEKIVQYTLEKEYTYLFNRFWKGTGALVKLLFALLFVFFIYMLYSTYKYTFNK